MVYADIKMDGMDHVFLELLTQRHSITSQKTASSTAPLLDAHNSKDFILNI